MLAFIDGATLDEEAVRQPQNLERIVKLIGRVHLEMPRHLRRPALSFWVFHVIRDYAWTLKTGDSQYLRQLTALLDAAAALEAAAGPIDVVFGHNDLLAANFIDDGTRIWLIDWDYAGFGSALFDLGGLASNNALTPEQEVWMLETYFETPVSAARQRAYAAMKCASLLRETLWSMVSERHSTLDFDYTAYTLENLERFEAAYQAFRGQ